VTQPRDRAERRCHIAVVGAGACGRSAQTALLATGFTDLVMLDRPGWHARFDDDRDTWLLTAADGEQIRADVVVAADRPVQRPWLPRIPGRDEFGGASFHAAAWDSGFDPSGKHIAVVGTDAAAGHHLPRLAQAAASVIVFAHAPRRIVTDIPLWSTRAARWLRRRTRPRARPSLTVAASAIEAVTASGVRTVDGVDHSVDAIIYGTGFFVPEDFADQTLVGAARVTIRQAWHDGMEPFYGVAVRGFPNYFFITGPDPDAQARYVAECLKAMRRTVSGRIEVRASSQQVFNERARLRVAEPPPVASAFDLSGSAPAGEDTYDGAATLEIAGARHSVRVRLTGHLDPIDGHYHWQGTMFGSAPDHLSDDILKQARTGTLTVGECSAPARIIERTPWGTHSVAGVGAPPYALSNH
jgi:cation diffusion facilitator CzcD-associated flavoprotein CzcO